MVFFRATLLECAARCTQACLATLTVERISIFLLGPCFFRSQFARFHIALHRPARPLSFGQLSCVLVSVWSTVLGFSPCFQLGTPVPNLAPGVRMINSRLCSSPL